jgi:hypothetical protein
MTYIFVNPQLINKIQKKVNELVERWNIHRDEIHTIFQMVATIESGMETKLFYDKDGLRYDGWNGYKNYENTSDANPSSAFGGFYRLDRHQMVGWSIYLIYQAEDKEAQASHCSLTYSYQLIWENEPRVWGFTSFEDYYTPEEQEAAADKLRGQKHVKRLTLEPKSEMSWMYRLRVQTTRKKSGLKTEWKERVAA